MTAEPLTRWTLGLILLLTRWAREAHGPRYDREQVLKQWLAFPAGDFSHSTGTNNPAGVGFASLAAKSPDQAVSLIHVGKIVEAVDGLFAQEGSP